MLTLTDCTVDVNSVLFHCELRRFNWPRRV